MPVNKEISINYAYTRELWDYIKMVLNDVFSFLVVAEILKDHNHEPRSIDECQSPHD